ncbi:MAG: type III PLP-dependent enzyme [Gammaproteobacteria bacterium]|nr:type III PLP-dependent enzyme [Gammaproteobacteria bacterium]MDH5629623.1 type III PLP-dependent enzyme [Gammaproteobacteria bacterium]
MKPFLSNEQIQQMADHYGAPLFIVDCDQVRKQYLALQEALPGVDFFYAVKAFPNDAVISTLKGLGAGFDLATKGEVDQVQRHFVNPRETIHTHPIKKDSEIKAALRFGCTTFVVDNIAELEKFVKYRHRVGLLLRVSFRSETAKVDLSRKFGCSADKAMQLIHRAQQMGIHIKGLSFHVGSQSATPATHVQAIEACADIINKCPIPLNMLDIGGGFPVNYDGSTADIYDFCQPIREALKQIPKDVHIIAEPGRFIAAPSAMTISSVVGKAVRGNTTWYYLDDGVYGSYSGRLFDHAQYPIRTLKSGELKPCVLAGPTCDSIDVIEEEIMLPELEIGDLVIGEMMGAYTAATATDFNSLERAKIIEINIVAESGHLKIVG